MAGWQDAPIADASSWQSAPEDEETKPKQLLPPALRPRTLKYDYQAMPASQKNAEMSKFFVEQVTPNTAAANRKEVLSKFYETFPAQSDPTETMSTGQRYAAGMGKGATDYARGAGQLTGILSQGEIDESRKLDAPLMNTTAGKFGDVTGKALPALAASFVPGANTYIGASVLGGTQGALEPTSGNESRLLNTAVGGVLGPTSLYAGSKMLPGITASAGKKVADLAANKTANAANDATLAASKDAGYVVPPTHANPSAVNRLLESIGGKAQTQQAAAVKNQPVTNELVRKELGLPDNTPITKEVLESLRQKAGKAYETLKGVGTFKADADFRNELAALSGEAGLTGANPEVHTLVNNLNKAELGSAAVVSELKRLRFHASKNMSSQDPIKVELGRAQRGAAGALEGLVERNLQQTGQADLLTNFQNARQLIAKTHTVEGALADSAGNVSARDLVKPLEKGKPLSGGLKKAAQFAQSFPKAAEPVKSSAGVSALDFIIPGLAGAGGAYSTGDPRLLALTAAPLARSGARSLILSKLYQNAMTNPSYAPSLTTRGLAAVNPAAKYLETPIAKRFAEVSLPSIYESRK